MTGKLADLTAFVESERTNPVRVRWQELRNTLSKLRLEPESRLDAHLTTWTALLCLDSEGLRRIVAETAGRDETR